MGISARLAGLALSAIAIIPEAACAHADQRRARGPRCHAQGDDQRGRTQGAASSSRAQRTWPRSSWPAISWRRHGSAFLRNSDRIRRTELLCRGDPPLPTPARATTFAPRSCGTRCGPRHVGAAWRRPVPAEQAHGQRLSVSIESTARCRALRDVVDKLKVLELGACKFDNVVVLAGDTVTISCDCPCERWRLGKAAPRSAPLPGCFAVPAFLDAPRTI